ncbi:MAG: DUF1638 domain-containing protein [Chloroflexi bacterium]|nr:DUF1638 domain-containing protein [Chloroflexota bacterium]
MTTALIACGALAREVLAIKEKHQLDVTLFCAPALLHNHPHKIPEAIRKRIRKLREQFDQLIVVYGDCGTGEMLDAMLDEEGVERIPGPHCYEMYAAEKFDGLMQEELGTFFLTDYMVRSFDHLVIEGLGLDEHPELRDDYFRRYKRVVYLAQTDNPPLLLKAQRAAESLRLPLEVRYTAYGALEQRLLRLIERSDIIK